MTLLIRLFVTGIIGLVIGLATNKLLYPADPAFYGDYKTTNAKGAYVLRIVDDSTAILVYTDQTEKRHAYRGKMQIKDNKFLVNWNEWRNGDNWEPMEKPVPGELTYAGPGRIESSEGAFVQVPKPLWKRILF